jgi:potassium-transporting ATPase KdpC subunit
MWSQLKPAALMLLAFTLLTGVVYPALVTVIAQLVFPFEANGSMLSRYGKPAGSALIGQAFHDPGHFWSRPSATSPYSYNAASSGGSNLGPTNPALADAVKSRVKDLQDADPGNRALVPVDLVTASASGLDPHISPAAAEYQVSRVARARHLDPAKVRELVARHTVGRQFGFLGEPAVDVLQLNFELDALR